MEKSFIGTEVTTQKSVTIGATAVLVSGKRDRKSVYIRNISAGGQRISLQFSNVDVAVDNTGIILNTNEFIIDSDSEGYKCWSGDISAISSAAGGVISIVER